MNNTIQLYSDSEKNNKVYPITSPDRVIDENGNSIKEKLNILSSSLDNIAHNGLVNTLYFEKSGLSDREIIINAINFCINNNMGLMLNRIYVIDKEIILKDIEKLEINSHKHGGLKKGNNFIGESIISFIKCENITIKDCHIDGGNINFTSIDIGDYGIEFIECKYINFSNNIVENFGDSCLNIGKGGVDYNSCYSAIVKDNIFNNIYQVSTTPNGCDNYIFENNECNNIGAIKFATRESKLNSHIIIRGNRINVTKNSNYGIELSGYNNISVINNFISGCRYAIGYYTNDSSSSVVAVHGQNINITDNICENVNTLYYHQNKAYIDGTSFENNVIIKNNRLISPKKDTETQAIIITGVNSVNSIIENNYFEINKISGDNYFIHIDTKFNEKSKTIINNNTLPHMDNGILLQNRNSTSYGDVIIKYNNLKCDKKIISTVGTLNKITLEKCDIICGNEAISQVLTHTNILEIKNNNIVKNGTVALNLKCNIGYMYDNTINTTGVSYRYDSGSTGTTYVSRNIVSGEISLNGQTETKI